MDPPQIHALYNERETWRIKVQSLQLQIRERFRVAVARHRHKQVFSDSYYSLMLQRWIIRIRDVYQSSSSHTSTVFYRKRVDKDLDKVEDSIIIQMLQRLAVPVIGSACHVFMHGLNQVQVYGVEKLHKALSDRSAGKPLLTVSNHVASIDDPFVIASLLSPSTLMEVPKLRWTLCATDRCFTNPMISAFFKCVKVLPVSRGEGIYQKGMDLALSKLNNGGWVHIFPEGSRSRDGGKTMGTTKRGVGRLVMDADIIPVVIPFVHTGMQEIMPIGARFPRIGKKVTVLVGDPIHFDDILLTMDDPKHISRGKLYDAVSSRISHRLKELKIQVENLILEQSFATQDYDYLHNSSRANTLLQQVDWEAFSIGNFISLEEEFSSLEPKSLTRFTENFNQVQEPICRDRFIRFGLSYDGGFVSRIRGYIDPTEFMGFAAKGLFMNTRKNWNENKTNIGEVGPLRAWKQLWEANILPQWRSM